jgi:SAM-dependent methyltransferase
MRRLSPRPTTVAGNDSGRAHRLGPGTIACVVDDDPRFHLDALRWYASLTGVAGVDPTDLVVHVVGRHDTDALDLLRSKGVTIRPVKPFDSRSPHCNKISGALSLAEENVEGVAVLTDADVVVCEDPRTYPVELGAVAMKCVDGPNPPFAIVELVFDKAGVELPPLVSLDFMPKSRTVEGNANGGIYLLRGELLRRLATAWSHWARWLLERIELLGPFPKYVDQIAMALALRDAQIAIQRLQPRWNMPTHVPKWIPRKAGPPAVLHYHEAVQTTALVSPVGNRVIDARIAACNAAISELWSERFPLNSFWDWRYRSNPVLGPGSGSRGAALVAKRDMLAKVLADVRPESTLDVGCGDGEATRGLPLPRYVGIDQSAEAVRLGRQTREGGEFVVGTLQDTAVVADLTICLDVLIYQPDPAAYRDLVVRLLRSSKTALLVSGYEAPPNPTAPALRFYEPLSTSIRRVAPDADLRLLRTAHGITTWLVDTRTTGALPPRRS